MRPSVLALVCCVACGTALPLRAQSETSDSALESALKFRRIHAPADRVQDWPRGNVRYVPIEGAEFERLVNLVRGARNRSRWDATRLERAGYAARLSERDLLVGTARLEITHPEPVPVLLSLAPCDMIVTSAQWDDGQATNATIGLAADGHLAVLVEKSGTLLIEFSIRADRDATSSTRFSLAFPKSPFSSLELELGADLSVDASEGILAAESTSEAAPRRWHLELGGRHACTLDIHPSDAASERRRLALLQEKVTYNATVRGLDVEAQWTLDVHNEPLKHLEVRLDPGLRLVAVQSGSRDLVWSTEQDTEQGTRAVIDLRDPLLGSGHSIRLAAVSPLDLDRVAPLPRIRAEGTFWREGSSALLVHAPLVVRELNTLLCRQTKVGRMSPVGAGESFEFQAYSPDATVEWMAARDDEPPNLLSATTVDFGPTEIRATWTADCQLPRQRQFELQCEVLPDWTIESVEATPARSLLGWNVAASEADARHVTIRATSHASPGKSVRLVVTGRRHGAGDGPPLPIELLRMVRPRDLRPGSHWLAIRPVANHRLRFVDADQFTRLAQRQLTQAQLSLLAPGNSGLLLELGPRPVRGEVAVENATPDFAAEVQVMVAARDLGVEESYLIRCQGSSAALTRVLIHFGVSRAQPPTWSVDSLERREFSVKRLTPANAADGAKLAGETWELILHRPLETSLTIRARRRTPWSARALTTSMLSLPEATNQRGLLAIQESQPGRLKIENRRLQPVPSISRPISLADEHRVSFLYDPTQDLATQSVMLRWSPQVRPSPTTLAWLCQLESVYQVQGPALHLATYTLSSPRESTVWVQPPANAEFIEAWLDDQPLARPDSWPRLEVQIPAGSDRSTLAIQYTTPGDVWGWLGSHAMQVPRTSVPVIQSLWSVHVPRGYDLVAARADDQRLDTSRQSALESIFGPLGRAPSTRPFNPLSLADWRDLVTFSAPGATRVAHPQALHASTRNASSKLHERLSAFEDWPVHQLELHAARIATVHVVRSTSVWAISCAAFLVGLVLGRALFRHRLGWYAFVAGLASAAALWVPLAWMLVPSAIFLGLCAALVWGIAFPARTGVRHAFRAAGNDSARASTSWISTPTTMGLLLVAMLVVCAPAGRAAPSDAKAGPKRVHRVFIPVDENRQPTGDRYLIPEELLDALQRGARAASLEPEGWLLRAATYSAELRSVPGTSNLTLSDLTVRMDVRVFTPRTRVRIPLASRDVRLIPDSAYQDGRAVDLEFDSRGKSLICDFALPGQFRLEFALRPTLRTASERTSIDLTIPPLATSTLELKLPSDLRGLDIDDAVMVPSQVPNAPSILARLGPSARLRLSWPVRADRPSTPPTMDVDQLHWLKIRPGSVVLEARLKYTVRQGEARRLTLALDRRLRLLPLEQGTSPIAQIHSLPDAANVPADLQAIELELTQPVTDQVEIQIACLLTGTSGLGNVHLPRLESPGATSSSRWLAISVDPALEYDVPTPDDADELPVNLFLDRWGPTDDVPQFANRVLPDARPWSIATRRRDPTTIVDQIVVLAFEPHGVEVELDARVRTIGGGTFQHRLLVPHGLQVSRVSVIQDDVQHLARFAPGRGDYLVIFLNEPVTGQQRLVIRGWIPLASEQTLELPRFALDQSRTDSYHLDVFRQSGVLVRLSQVSGFQLVPASEAMLDPPEFGRHVASLESLGSPGTMTLRVEPNHVSFSATQLVSLLPSEGNWRAEVDLRLAVQGGLLDECRLGIPPTWTGPYEIDPPCAWKLVEIPGEDVKSLVLRPRRAMEKDARFVIRGPLLDAANNRVHYPDIVPRNARQLTRWVALPTREAGERLNWITRGMESGELPAEFPGLASTFQVQQVRAEHPTARIGSLAASATRPLVRLAEMHLALNEHGVEIGAAVFDILPARQQNCTLRLPAGAHLLRATVDGVTVHPTRLAPRDYRLDFTSDELGQRIEILYDQRVDRDASTWRRWDAELPRLVDFDVHRALCTLYALPRSGAVRLEAANAMSRLEYDLERLEDVVSLGDSGSRDGPGVTAPLDGKPATDHEIDPEVWQAEEGLSSKNLLSSIREQWFRSWDLAFVRVRLDLDRFLRGHPQVKLGQATRAELNALDRKHQQSRDRVGLAWKLNRKLVDSESDDSPLESFRRVFSPRRNVTRYVLAPETSDVRISLAPVLSDESFHQHALSGGLAALGLLFAVLLTWSRSRDLVHRWSCAICVAIGLAWWLWLTPSVLGWVWVLGGIGTSLRPGWRARVERIPSRR